MQTCRMIGFINSAAYTGVCGEGSRKWIGEKGLNILYLENCSKWHCRANLPLLCRVSWEMTLPTLIAVYLLCSVLLARAHQCPIRSLSYCLIAAINPLLLTLHEQITGKQVCCIWPVNWVSAPQICFFGSPFYLVFNTKQPPLITSRLKTLSD